MTDASRWGRVLCALAVGWLVAACGGGPPHAGSESPGAAGSRAADRFRDALAGLPAARRLRAAAAAAPVDADDAADQLLNFAETQFPQYFPGPQDSATWEGYRYRHYPASGIYLGVRNGDVFVLGGVFGAAAVRVGPLTDFVSPVAGASRLPCAQPARAYGIYTTPSPAVGRNASAVVLGCSGPLASVQWRQTDGPAVQLLSDRHQAISFDPPAAGRYAFELTLHLPDGGVRVQTVALSVAAAGNATGLTLRNSQAVRAGGPVSVRAWLGPEVAADAVVSWAQIDGPSLTLAPDAEDDRLVTFTAPNVVRDQLARLRATTRSVTGAELSDEVLVVIEAHPQASAVDSSAIWAGEHVQRVTAYRASSRWASALQPCVYDSTSAVTATGTTLCLLSRLPYIGQTMAGAEPTVDEIMDRVVVSHAWQGRNFERFLQTQDVSGDIRRMLASVTAIVIGSSIRPSSYFPVTGAIYLDADDFWLTPEERDTLTERPDPRSAYDDGLQYGVMWRYARDGQEAYPYLDPGARITRGLEAIRAPASALLFHELTHAADYMPQIDLAGLALNQIALDAFWPRYADYRNASDRLRFRFPLISVTLLRIAEVKYRGRPPTEREKSLLPAQIAEEFAADTATDEYAYTDAREDLAMLAEEFLMRHRLGYLRDVAITDKITAETRQSTLIVRWGQRGRAGEPLVRQRVRLAIQEVLPWIEPAESERAALPVQLPTGVSWMATLGSGSSGAARQATSDPLADARQRAGLRRWWLRQQQRHHHGPQELTLRRLGGAS